MRQPLSRRSFLELAAAGMAACASPSGADRTDRASRRSRHVAVGVGGMGAVDLERIAAHPEVDVVALCDVDARHLEAAAGTMPGARLFRDWRILFEEVDFDSVNVTVPDHMHAVIAMHALRAGKHVYCQKPLTRTVQEARALAAEARRAGVVTQMGIQNRSGAPYSQALALFRAGHIGKVREVHVWTDRPADWWPQGMEREPGSRPVPDFLDWDLWLGCAPERPYLEGYHPFAWRGRKDFGTGAQGDMGCHLMDPALWFLELEAPRSARSEGPSPNDESFPLWSTVRYEFPPSRWTSDAPLPVIWYDGGKRPPREVFDAIDVGEVTDNKCLFLGDEGALLADPYAPPTLHPRSRFENVPVPEGRPTDHWHEWIDACRGMGVPSAPFEYAAFLTEVALLGNVALHFPGERLAYDSAGMRFPERPEADRLLVGTYRDGFGARGIG